jgi:hypothetical protein
VYDELRSLVDGCFITFRSLVMKFSLVALRLYLLVNIFLIRCALSGGGGIQRPCESSGPRMGIRNCFIESRLLSLCGGGQK